MITEALVTFIEARLTEDEQWARTASRPSRHALPGAVAPDSGVHWQWAVAAAGHIVRHDPARVLRQVAATRRILDMHSLPDGTDGDWSANPPALCSEDRELLPCTTLRLLALPWSDHPDYRQEWAP